MGFNQSRTFSRNGLAVALCGLLLAGNGAYSLADGRPPSAAVGPTSAVPQPYYTLYLKHISPVQVLQKMGWTQDGQAHPFGSPDGATGSKQVPLPDGVTHVYAIEHNQTLLVYGTAQGYDSVKQIVSILDVEARQVEIKVEFVTAKVADIKQSGINFSAIPASATSATFPVNQHPGGAATTGITNTASTYLQFIYGNVAVQLYDLVTEEHNKVISAPTITTTNNVAAQINFEDEIPSTNLVTKLEVVPHVNSDDTVTLDFQPTFETPSSGPSVGGQTTYNQETLMATRTVRSGEMMVLGGVINKREGNGPSQEPIVGGVVSAGAISRSPSSSDSDSELLIFVTPTIVPMAAGGTLRP